MCSPCFEGSLNAMIAQPSAGANSQVPATGRTISILKATTTTTTTSKPLHKTSVDPKIKRGGSFTDQALYITPIPLPNHIWTHFATPYCEWFCEHLLSVLLLVML
jgi:hypothetical protein